MNGRISELIKGKRWLILIIFVAVTVPWLINWAVFRFTHSITRDAFVDSNLINVAPQVAGALVEMRVLEQDVVSRGQVLAVVDPSTYTRKAEAAGAKLAVAEESYRRAQVDLALLEKTVPMRIQIAEQKLSMAMDAEISAREKVNMVVGDVEKGISAAVHTVKGAKAKMRMARDDYLRYEALSKAQSVPLRRFQEATRTYDVSRSEVKVAEAKLAMAESAENEIGIAEQNLKAACHAVREARSQWELAKLATLEIDARRIGVAEKARQVESARRECQLAEINLSYCRVRAPFGGVIAKKWRHAGDYAHAGAPVFTLYNKDLLYVTANLGEDLLDGVHEGNPVVLDVVAFDNPFRGRVLWIGSATDAKFSLIPRDVSSGEFTYIVQRVPVRIWIERDDRWNRLKPGLSVKAAIRHGPGDPDWTRKTLQKETTIERLGKSAP